MRPPRQTEPGFWRAAPYRHKRPSSTFPPAVRRLRSMCVQQVPDLLLGTSQETPTALPQDSRSVAPRIWNQVSPQRRYPLLGTEDDGIDQTGIRVGPVSPPPELRSDSSNLRHSCRPPLAGLGLPGRPQTQDSRPGLVACRPPGSTSRMANVVLCGFNPWAEVHEQLSFSYSCPWSLP